MTALSLALPSDILPFNIYWSVLSILSTVMSTSRLLYVVVDVHTRRVQHYCCQKPIDRKIILAKLFGSQKYPMSWEYSRVWIFKSHHSLRVWAKRTVRNRHFVYRTLIFLGSRSLSRGYHVKIGGRVTPSPSYIKGLTVVKFMDWFFIFKIIIYLLYTTNTAALLLSSSVFLN